MCVCCVGGGGRASSLLFLGSERHNCRPIKLIDCTVCLVVASGNRVDLRTRLFHSPSPSRPSLHTRRVTTVKPRRCRGSRDPRCEISHASPPPKRASRPKLVMQIANIRTNCVQPSAALPPRPARCVHPRINSFGRTVIRSSCRASLTRSRIPEVRDPRNPKHARVVSL